MQLVRTISGVGLHRRHRVGHDILEQPVRRAHGQFAMKRDAGRFERDLQQIERDTGHQYSAAEVAGVYRHLYDNAERAVASQRSFGTRFAAGRHIDTGKGKAYREAEMNLVARHIRSIVGGGLGQADGDMWPSSSPRTSSAIGSPPDSSSASTV